MKAKRYLFVGVLVFTILFATVFGFTYAFYRTRIIGNDNGKSISIISEILELTFLDDNVIISGERIVPGFTGEKTFSITNTGNEMVEDYIVYLEDVINEFVRLDDWTYTLTCTATSGSCKGSQGTLPAGDSILVINDINEDVTHTYTLKINYLNSPTEDQSIDMGARLSGKINVRTTDSDNPFVRNKDLLAYNIVRNAMIGLNGTEYRKNPIADIALESSSKFDDNDEDTGVSRESTLAEAEDDYGTSYYYRGDVNDNYLNYAGMCFKIVRIQGDGSIKLVLEDINAECDSSSYTGNFSAGSGNYGYVTSTTNSGENNYLNNYLEPTVDADVAMVNILKNFQTSKLSNYLTKLKSGDWCYDDTAYKYSSGSYVLMTDTEVIARYGENKPILTDSLLRFNNNVSTLKCSGTKLTNFADNTSMYVGALTADEIVHAGGKFNVDNKSFYLLNDYAINNSKAWISFTPAGYKSWYGRKFYVTPTGELGQYRFTEAREVRPSIILNTGVKISSGNGLKSNPYEIV